MILKGLRVVDFSRYLPGPYATLRLADMGAEVIKVESRAGGDPARHVGETINGVGLGFLAVNRNKKSVTVNFKEDEGRALAFRLASQADVVLESFRPGIAASLGIGYEKLRAVRPDLIYCSLTGFGQTGSMSEDAGHDLNFMAQSGLLSQLKDQEGRPVLPSIQLGDLFGGMAGTEAILAALIKRGISGEGSYIAISLTDVLIGLLGGHILAQNVTGQGVGLVELAGKLVCYNLYQCQDGRYMALAALEEKFWLNFCQEAGCPELSAGHLSEARADNPTFQALQQLFKSKTFSEWTSFAARVDCCLSPVREVGDLVQDEEIKKRGLLWASELINWGTADSNLAGAPPRLGEHNDQVYSEILQATEEEIASWKRRKII